MKTRLADLTLDPEQGVAVGAQKTIDKLFLNKALRADTS
jgi:hypothetical protein